MANKNNPGIIKTDSPIEYTKHMIEEMQRCVVDPVYFIKNYVYIKHPKRGKIIFNITSRMVL